MTVFPGSKSSSTDPEIAQSLQGLFAPIAQPQFRAGFDRRLAHAVAIDIENRRRSRTLRWVLWTYWVGAAAVSTGIIWHFQDRLLSGPGLWVSIATLATLIGAGLPLWILAALPVKLRRGHFAPR